MSLHKYTLKTIEYVKAFFAIDEVSIHHNLLVNIIKTSWLCIKSESYLAKKSINIHSTYLINYSCLG